MTVSVINDMRPLRYSTQGKTQWIIKPLEKISAVVYTSDEEGNYIATSYTRKALKPQINHRFKTRERRDQYVKNWVDNLVKREQEKVDRRAQRTGGHTLEVGDVLNTSWGYDQTNVDYFQVVAIPSKASVTLRKITSIAHDDSHVLPAVDSFVGEAFKKRVDGQYNSVKMGSSEIATPTDKNEDGSYKPSYRTPWGMGH